MTQQAKMISWVVRAIATTLAALVAWRAGPAVADALVFRAAAVVAIYIAVAALLIGSAVVLDICVRRHGLELSRGGAPLLALLCALSLAIGNSQAIFLRCFRLQLLFCCWRYSRHFSAAHGKPALLVLRSQYSPPRSARCGKLPFFL
jgi:hypothetical protein